MLAAHKLESNLGDDWLPIGVSQGGHASLWAAAIGDQWARKLHVVGVVALAPVTHSSLLVEAARNLGTPTSLAAGGALAFIGAKTAGANLDSFLSETGISMLPDAYSRCLPALQQADSWGGVPPRDLLRPDADLGPLYAILDANEASTLTLHVPAFIATGTADDAFPPALVGDLVDQLRAKGADVTYTTYEGVQHGGPEVLAAYDDFSPFITALFEHAR